MDRLEVLTRIRQSRTGQGCSASSSAARPPRFLYADRPPQPPAGACICSVCVRLPDGRLPVRHDPCAGGRHPGDPRAARPSGPEAPHPRAAPAQAHRHKHTIGERAAKVALKAVGVPYHWGGSSPSSGFDCSGLVYWAYEHGACRSRTARTRSQAWGAASSTSARATSCSSTATATSGSTSGTAGWCTHRIPERVVQVVKLGRSNYGDAVISARRVTRA